MAKGAREWAQTFDYAASAELFVPKRNPGARHAVSYRRFTTEAIRFAVEEFPALRSDIQ